MEKEQTDKIFNTITSNGCREMNEVRFHQAVNEIDMQLRKLVKNENIMKIRDLRKQYQEEKGYSGFNIHNLNNYTKWLEAYIVSNLHEHLVRQVASQTVLLAEVKAELEGYCDNANNWDLEETTWRRDFGGELILLKLSDAMDVIRKYYSKFSL